IAYVQQLTTANIQKASFDPVKETTVSQPQPITQGSRQAVSPDLSPDGEWLVFYEAGKQEDLFLVKADGTGLRQLTNDIYKDRYPRWSPDGKRIAFHSNRAGKHDIWVINPDGSGLERLTYAPGPAVYFPVWSPDGKRLAYSIQDANPFPIDITKPWKEQSPKPVVVEPELGPRFNVRSWSPDGRKLAGGLQKADFTSRGLGIYFPDSEKLEKLSDFGWDPVWLGDSRRLLVQ